VGEGIKSLTTIGVEIVGAGSTAQYLPEALAAIRVQD